MEHAMEVNLGIANVVGLVLIVAGIAAMVYLGRRRQHR
jgi:hypothetical protein